METLEAYLTRKSSELSLLNRCLTNPLTLQQPRSPAEVIEQKFQIASALKAEHAIQDWAITETAWAHPGTKRAGPFEFSYDYQRADLEVRGPSFYAFEHPDLHDAIYTSSGMSAISAILFAAAKLMPSADIMVLPGSYGETSELLESYIHDLRTVQLAKPAEEIAAAGERPRILLLDSSSLFDRIETVLRCPLPRLDLIVFDTTCFSSSSGRIGRVLKWARRSRIPVIMIRSHTKLDSLGVEYGRLGSAVFVGAKRTVKTRERDVLQLLAKETRQAVRLFGGAALPAHFPPFAGTACYRALTDRRIASILRNSRRTSWFLARTLNVTPRQLHSFHGLYLTMAPAQEIDESQARQIADELSSDLATLGMPVRHAGSFGFDFGATEWFHDTISNRYSVRVAVPDLPTALWDEIANAIAVWWSSHQLVSVS